MKHLDRATPAYQRVLGLCAVLGVGLLATLGVDACQSHPATTPPTAANSTSPSVPSEYRNLYNGLKTELDTVGANLAKQYHGEKYTGTFGAELLPANSNIGPGLLAPSTLPSTILYLNGLKKLGVTGVTVALQYPLFTPSFPQYSQYLAFYKQVAAQIRKLHMKLEIEAHLLFANTIYSPVTFDWSKLSFAQFESGYRQMQQTIIDQLHPDFLSILGEPDTAAKLTGYSQFNDPDQVTQFVNYVLKGLKRGKTKVGAGTGSWIPTTIVADFAAKTSVDFISIHVYPVTTWTINNALTMISLAQQHHKHIVIDEMWLYKVLLPAANPSQNPSQQSNGGASGQRTGAGNSVAIYRLDNYSFWQPLDQEFLREMTMLAAIGHADYISAFWSNLFFGYVDYNNSTANTSYRQLMNARNRNARQNLESNAASPTGSYYQQLVHKGPSAR